MSNQQSPTGKENSSTSTTFKPAKQAVAVSGGGAPAAGTEREKTELMDLLHQYNDIKDATQKVLGALAVMDGVTVKEMHVKYNLPLDS